MSFYSPQETSYRGRASVLTVLSVVLTGCAASDSIGENSSLILSSPNGGRHVSAAPPEKRALKSGGIELLSQAPAPQVRANLERRLPTISDNKLVTLNYTDADVREVVNDVMSNILAMPVIIDPSVGGKLTLRTSGKVSASDVPRLLDQALAKYGYGLAAGQGGGARVARLADLTGGGLNDFQVIPVRYVDPAEVINVIRPNLEEGVHLTLAPGQRGIAISGPAGRVSSARELITLLDSDVMIHKHFALFTLSHASPAAVERELKFLFNPSAEGARRIRFSSLERLNGILAVADDPAALDQARYSIAKLDRTSTSAANIYVRKLKYRSATELAQVLAVLVGAPQQHSSSPPLPPAGEAKSVSGGSTDRTSLPNKPRPSDVGSSSTPLTAQVRSDEMVPSVNLGLSAPVRIEADRSQNALLILAGAHDLGIIDAAIRRLDVKPRQVLIQAIVAEVRLSDELAYGVDYLLSSLELGATPKAGLSYVFPGTGINAVLHALNALAEVKVVSAPRLLALDNEVAKIQVGDQVPILSRASQSTASDSSPIISNVELRDTGVILNVKPRIGSSGSVLLDIHQEVSTANRNALTNVQSPVISVRRLQSQVLTQNGDTIAIGGLMEDSADGAAVGIPGLMKIPLVGTFFRSTELSKRRTELLVLINPRVLESEAEASSMMDELRDKIVSIAPDLGPKLASPRRLSAQPKRSRALDHLRETEQPSSLAPL